jgi:hypothetical protein
MMVGAIGALVLIRSYGETLVAPPAAAVTSFAAATASRSDVLVHVLVALTAVIVTGLILARCFAYLGQPPVIGEVVAGIVLGRSRRPGQAFRYEVPNFRSLMASKSCTPPPTRLVV